MPHWSSSPEAGRELESEYEAVLLQYRELTLSGATAAEVVSFKRDVMDPLAQDLRAARAHWRAVGEALTVQALNNNQPLPEGARTFAKLENSREGFEAPNDPSVGEPIWDVEQDPETGEKKVKTKPGKGKDKTKPNKDEEAQP